MSSFKRIGRRQVLKGLTVSGATVAVGLPLLRIALNDNGEALADGTPIPTRFGLWYWGTGIRPGRWIPSGVGQGDAWSLSAELAPLAGVKDLLSVVTNGKVQVDYDTSNDNPHPVGAAGVLTGDNFLRIDAGSDAQTVRRPSVDQLAAAQLSGNTPRRSLEVGIYHAPPSRFGGTLRDNISHNGPNAPNPPEFDLRALFYRLFPNANGVHVADARRSVLDVVQEQTHELQKVLGAEDRHRLDQHLDGIRGIEQVISTANPNVVLPPPPSNIVIVDGNREAVVERNRIASQLLALALSMRTSHVFSVMFNAVGGEDTVLSHIANGSTNIHALTHAPSPQDYDVIFHDAVVFAMDLLGQFLMNLRNTPEGAGNLLEQCSIVCTSELSDAHIHSLEEFPLLVAGRGGGRLRGNVHHRFGSPTNISRAVLTALRGAGVSAGSFGVGGAYTDSSIAELEA